MSIGDTVAWGEHAEHIKLLYDRYPGMPPSVIARKVGCDPSNVTHVINRYVKSCSLEELEDFRSCKPEILEATQHRFLTSLTDEKVKNMSGLQAITGFAILEDKIRLMRGQPTSIHVTALLDIADMIKAQDNE